MKEKKLLERLEALEYHIRLLSESVAGPEFAFTKLVVANKLTEHETAGIMQLCERLNKVMEEQKAEGFLNFHPLFQELSIMLPDHLEPGDVILACIRQKMFTPLMNEFKKFI